MTTELLYLGMRYKKKKKKRSSSLKVILEKGNSLVPAETIKVLIKNIKIPHANNPTAKTITVE